ncbi:MAG: protein translocase subunit SecF, partial [Agitococcus sp.]|jgi:preprotein translocase subunit SecF|nr:protein translocase subunit SecF [Moraxellaceae bacterium]MBK8326273.1 protein translocase subunit SecF [Moraxellaceae bacterium]MBK9187242.1 protein translocase subunit SecF [Moraxellaceae bacterium]MBL0229973.1 protein translocase subunit SecF [Moraxellaceae bacterium]MBP9215925.1 protein translocase subunit SecF [Agitococcus sp.]
MAEEKIIAFMRFRKPMAIFSLIVVLIGLASIITKGLNLGLDFTGGTSVELEYAKPVGQMALQEALEKAGVKDTVVQHVGSASQVLIRMPPQEKAGGEIGQRVLHAAQFDAQNPATLRQVDSVGSQVGSELYSQSLLAIGMSLFLMMVYVAVRFRFKFAVGAVISLVHDTIFTVGVFSIMGWPFDLTVLAAVLALIGYSLNDTIVVFDRVRENFRRLRRADPVEIIDISLTETLRRTIMTVATVVIVVVALLFLGGTALKWFSVALLVGLFAGTYSSIYIATSYALAMGLNKEDFMIMPKSEFVEEDVVDVDEVKP